MRSSHTYAWRTAPALVRSRTSLLLLVVALMVCTFATTRSASAQSASERYGIVVFDMNGSAPAQVSALGTGIVRGACDWANIETSQGTYNWSCTDNIINADENLGLKTYMSIGCTPGWANGNGGCATMTNNVDYWYEFVQHFVTRYSASDVILGVWNEPNLSQFLNDNSLGSEYCDLYVVASEARDDYNPSFALGGPETNDGADSSGYYANTMACINNNGGMASQDVVTVHWYPGGPSIPTYMDHIHASAGSHKVWLTETGYGSSSTTDQANYYTQLLENFLWYGASRPWWTNVTFYRLYDGTNCCGEAILYSNYSGKPAFYSYQDWISDATGQSAGTMSANTYIYPNDSVTSANGSYYLKYQSDGNLVLYNSANTALWASNTSGTSAGHAVMQGDGNLVVYNASGSPVWASNTSGHSNAYCVVQDNGDLVIYDVHGSPLNVLY